MADMLQYVKTESLSSDASQIIETARKAAYMAVDRILVLRNWLLGKRISEENMGGSSQERYGAQIIKELSTSLTIRYGKGFDCSSLYRYVQFYNMFPKIVAAPEQRSSGDPEDRIVAAVRQQSHLLSWTHCRILLQVLDPDARAWYEKVAYEQPFLCTGSL